MAEFLSQRLIARLGALLFVLSGLVTLLNLALPSTSVRNITAMIVIGTTAIAVGTVAWFLPWQRWPRRATLPLVPVAFYMIALGGTASLRPWTYAVYWVVVFVWLGVAHPRWMSVKFAPLATASYITPFLVVDHGGIDAFTSVGVVIPVCLLVGESLAWISGMLRSAEMLDIRRMTDMEALLDATVSLARQDDATAAANLVTDLAVRLLRADAAIVLLADATGTFRNTGAARGALESGEYMGHDLDAPAQEALASGAAVAHQGGVVGPLTQAVDGAPALFLPLGGAGDDLGLILVTFRTGTRLTLDAFASGLARTFATQASLAFNRLHATQILLDASMRDALTGVGNRRRADALLASIRPGDAIALLDLDHFKDVNDRWGHAVGDEVLVRLARHLEQCLREGDAVARFGGEEFLIVLRSAGNNSHLTMARLCDGWRQSDQLATFSAGVAIHTVGCSAQATLAEADVALYAAKDAGRDRVQYANRRGGGTALDLVGIA